MPHRTQKHLLCFSNNTEYFLKVWNPLLTSNQTLLDMNFTRVLCFHEYTSHVPCRNSCRFAIIAPSTKIIKQ